MKPILLLDFDRTLFDTDRFWGDFSNCLADLSDFDSRTIFDDYEQYVSNKGKLRYIDYNNLIERYNIDHDQVQSLVNKRLKNKQYLYSDAIEVVKLITHMDNEIDTAIVTFGQDRFQTLKIAICQELNDFVSYVTQLPKTEFIKYYMSNRTGLLVDDKLGQDLPRGWTEVHLNRKSVRQPSKKLRKSVYEIYGLDQLPEIIKNQSKWPKIL